MLVNNAGISPLYGQLSAVSEELWDKVIGVNLKGPFRLCALVGERMDAGAGGSIINLSSTGSVRPTGDIVPYAAAKAGVNAMTIGLADAFGPQGPRQRDHARPVPNRHRQELGHGCVAEQTETFPLRRAGEAREIVGAALTWPATRRRSPRGRSSRSTAGRSGACPAGAMPATDRMEHLKQMTGRSVA